jgi:tetratricopeptide (TPR) repeat protein
MKAVSKYNSVLSLPLFVLAALLMVGAASAQDENMGAAPPAANEEPGTNEQLFDRTDMGNVTQAAMNLYHAGHRNLERARKLEEKAAEADPAKREKAMAKVEKAYEQAADSYLQAIRTNPSLFDAYTELGDAFRHLGKHPEAIQVHSKALELTPNDPTNVYGRAESFLALNYLREAATAYTELSEAGDEHADLLMESLKRWVVEKREDPGELRPDAVETLAAWIEQQANGSG